jgi:starch synthase
MAHAISRLLSDPAGARRMGEAGRVRALERFSFRRHVDEHEMLYRRIIEERQ